MQNPPYHRGLWRQNLHPPWGKLENPALPDTLTASLCHTDGGTVRHSRLACFASDCPGEYQERGCEPKYPSAQVPGSGKRGTHSTIKVRLRAPSVWSSRQQLSQSRHWKEAVIEVTPATSGQLSVAGSRGVDPADAGREARHFAVMRWTPVGRPWQRDQPRNRGREPSSPFPIMTWAGLDRVRIPKSDILLSLRIQKTYWLARSPHVIYHLFIRACAEVLQ